ncbi:metallophosphoesterase [Candidatus Woesearchaeota archaeon]|nr:metallophosphoesterase [Candidatus Woesearchaeota archaeon]
MELVNRIRAVDLGLFIEPFQTLVIADIHIGFEEAINRQGILVPRLQFKDTVQKLEKLLIKTKPEKVVINGDLKHEFGKISEQEWRETLKILDLISKHGKEITLIKGNHDTILGPIAQKREVEIAEYLILGSILIIHGDKIPENVDLKKTKTIIIGHEHPAITIREQSRQETFKCFLLGKWKKLNLIVQPSFNLVTQGTDILKEQLLSPFLTNISNFEIIVVADKLYKFGKVKRLLEL